MKLAQVEKDHYAKFENYSSSPLESTRILEHLVEAAGEDGSSLTLEFILTKCLEGFICMVDLTDENIEEFDIMTRKSPSIRNSLMIPPSSLSGGPYSY